MKRLIICLCAVSSIAFAVDNQTIVPETDNTLNKIVEKINHNATNSATINYVNDVAGGAALEYFFYGSQTSSVSGFYKALSTPSSGGVNTNAFSGVTNNQYIASYITEPGYPGITLLRGGVYSIHGHFRFTARSNALALAAVTPELYIYDSNGVFKAEIETGSTTALTYLGNTEVMAHLTVTNDIAILATDRIASRWKVTGIGTYNVGISSFTEGTTAARFEIETELGSFPTHTEVTSEIATAINALDNTFFDSWNVSTNVLTLSAENRGDIFRFTGPSCVITIPSNSVVNWEGVSNNPSFYFRIATTNMPSFADEGMLNDPNQILDNLATNKASFAIVYVTTNSWDVY